MDHSKQNQKFTKGPGSEKANCVCVSDVGECLHLVAVRGQVGGMWIIKKVV